MHARHVGIAVADVAWPESTRDAGASANAYFFLQQVNNFRHGMTIARPHVDNVVGGCRHVQRHSKRLGHIVDVDEVPAFLAILEDVNIATLLERVGKDRQDAGIRSEEHTSELQSLMRISYAVFCLTKTNY